MKKRFRAETDAFTNVLIVSGRKRGVSRDLGRPGPHSYFPKEIYKGP